MLFAAALAMQTSQGFSTEVETKAPEEPVASDKLQPSSVPAGGSAQETTVPDAPKPQTDKKKPVFDPDYSPCSALPVTDRSYA